MTGVTARGRDNNAEENVGPIQYKRAVLRTLKNVLNRARSMLSAAQRRYKRDFDRKLTFHPTINAGDLVYVNRPPRTLIESGEPGDWASRRGHLRSVPKVITEIRSALLHAVGHPHGFR